MLCILDSVGALNSLQQALDLFLCPPCGRMVPEGRGKPAPHAVTSGALESASIVVTRHPFPPTRDRCRLEHPFDPYPDSGSSETGHLVRSANLQLIVARS